jgi:hypothetical protein
VLGGLISGPGLYVILPKEEFGKFIFFSSVLSLAQAFDFGLGSNLQSTLPKFSENTNLGSISIAARGYIYNSLKASLMIGTLGWIAFSVYYSQDPFLCLLLLIGVPLMPLGHVYRVLVFTNRYHKALMIQSISTAVSAITIYIFALVGAGGGICALVGCLVSIAFAAYSLSLVPGILRHPAGEGKGAMFNMLRDSRKYALLQPLAHGGASFPIMISTSVVGLAATADMGLCIRIFGVAGSVLSLLQPRYWNRMSCSWIQKRERDLYETLCENLKVCFSCIALNTILCIFIFLVVRFQPDLFWVKKITRTNLPLVLVSFAWVSSLHIGVVVGTSLNAIGRPQSQIIAGSLYICLAAIISKLTAPILAEITVPVTFGACFLLVGLCPTAFVLYKTIKNVDAKTA